MKFLSIIFAAILIVSSAQAASLPPVIPGIPSGALQYNNNGSFGGLPVSGSAAAQAALQGLMGLPIIYAANFGVVANGQKAVDVSSTSGSAVITSASFTSANQTNPPQVINCYCGTNQATTATIVNGSSYITVASATGIAPLQSVVGTGIQAGTIVKAINGTQVYLSLYPTASGSGVATTFINPISTTITTASNGTATMAANAGTTVSGTRAYFGTDDTTAWRSTVSTASSGVYANGAVIMAPYGDSMITGPINNGNWPSGVSLLGQGPHTSTLRWASPNTMNVSNPAIIYQVGLSYSTATHDVTIANIGMNMDAAFDSPYDYNGTCIRMPYNRNLTIFNDYFSGSPATCLGVDYPQNQIVANNVFENNARLGVQGGGSYAVLLGEVSTIKQSITFVDNVIINSGVFGFMAENTNMASTPDPTVPSNSAVVQGNTFYYQGYQPNAIEVWAIQDAGLWGAQITGNTVFGPAINSTNYVGIGTGCGDIGCTYSNQAAMHGNIANNTVVGMGTPYYITGLGVNNYRVDHNIAESGGRANTGCYGLNGAGSVDDGDVFSDNSGWKCSGAGFILIGSGTDTNLTLQNNKFVDNGSGLSQPYGIALNANLTGLNATGNESYDDGAGVQNYGLSVASGFSVTKANVQTNNFHDNVTSAYSIVGTLSGIVTNNGAQPSFTVSGCSATTPVGQADLGTFVSGTTGTCSVTVLFNGTANINAPHGYACAQTLADLTTNADTLKLTASTVDSCTYSGTTVSGDVISLSKAVPF